MLNCILTVWTVFEKLNWLAIALYCRELIRVDGVCSSSIDGVPDLPHGSRYSWSIVVFLVHCWPSRATSECAGWLCWRYHILVIGHLWQHHWMMIWLWPVISDWCSKWGMLVNPSKTRGMLISRSRTIEPLIVPWFGCWWYCCWNVILDSKLAFEKQVKLKQ